VLVHSSGFRMSPYADIKPAGDDSVDVARKLSVEEAQRPSRNLWHRSPGSPG
jgi:error-prone DNA polymerase